MKNESANPNLHDYHLVLINSSAGKDSQAMLDYVVELADAQGYPRERLVVVHADLGDRVEWAGVKELVLEQAAHYGLRVEFCSRIGGTCARDGKVYRDGETFGDLLDYAERRQMWPSSASRYCTSDFKRGPIGTVVTRLQGEARNAGVVGKNEQYRVLSCLGMRAQESRSRAKRDEFLTKTNNRNVRVDEWMPLKHWMVEQVWDRIRRSGVRHHWAYDRGMTRLSCMFCVFAGRTDLMVAGAANPELLREYVDVESRIGHTFQAKRPLAETLEALEVCNYKVEAPSAALFPRESDEVPCDQADLSGEYMEDVPEEENEPQGEAEALKTPFQMNAREARTTLEKIT